MSEHENTTDTEVSETTREAHAHSPGFGVSHKFPSTDTREVADIEEQLAEVDGAGDQPTGGDE